MPLFNRCLTVMNSKYYIISLYHIIDIKNYLHDYYHNRIHELCRYLTFMR
jgi:hypothetical protein